MKTMRTKLTANRFHIGANIRKWRNIREIKQKDLAASMGLSEAAVSNIENDVTNVTLSQLEDISTALNISIEKLLSDPQKEYVRLASPEEDADLENLNRRLVHAIINSLQKKDEQIQELMAQLISANTTKMLQPSYSGYQLNEPGG